MTKITQQLIKAVSQVVSSFLKNDGFDLINNTCFFLNTFSGSPIEWGTPIFEVGTPQ
jgi:hypothetical protein